MDRSPHRTAVLLPLVSIPDSEPLLAGSAPSRALSRIIRDVIEATKGFRVVVVAPESSPDIQRCALVNGARYFSVDANLDPNQALNAALTRLRELDYQRAAVLRQTRLSDWSWLRVTRDVVLVPNENGLGTNAISLPTDCDFHFAFGHDSFAGHVAEAQRHHLDVHVTETSLSFVNLTNAGHVDTKNPTDEGSPVGATA